MSSSESEDENLKQLLEAADTSLFYDAMFREPRVENSVKPDCADKNNVMIRIPGRFETRTPVELPASNRYLNEEESVFQSDLNVTESMKKFIGKKLSTLIADSIAFVDIKPVKRDPRTSESSGVRLLRGFGERLEISCEGGNVPVIIGQGKPIKRRIVEDDFAVSKNEMIEQAAYDADTLSKSTVGWTDRPKSKLYEYRQAGKSEVLTLSMTDEFSTARRKNNWDDAKIKTFRRNR
uniref:(northern house mosquito) hypothetical protein n=2 Tax=Culex pipiens TaxID=7175 RepID=A0A8D8CY57_CULPI